MIDEMESGMVDLSVETIGALFLEQVSRMTTEVSL